MSQVATPAASSVNSPATPPRSDSLRRAHSGASRVAAASGVRSPAGRSNSRSRTACTRVPRTAADDGCWGKPVDRAVAEQQRQVMKSPARDGDSADGGSPATPNPAPGSMLTAATSTTFSTSTEATVGQPTDIPQPSPIPRAAAPVTNSRPNARSIGIVASGQEEQPEPARSRSSVRTASSWRGCSASPCTSRRTGSSSPASSSSSTPTSCRAACRAPRPGTWSPPRSWSCSTSPCSSTS